VLASGSADTDRVFRGFLRLCEAAGSDRCALAGHGPVAPRVNRLLHRLRQAPLARNAPRAARRLGNAVLLTHDGYGHLSRRDPSTCVMQATGRYLVDLTTPPRGTVCSSDRLPFDPLFGQPVP
jgi:TAP-like protein